MSVRDIPAGEPSFFSACTAGATAAAGNYTVGLAFTVNAIGSIIWGMNLYAPYDVAGDTTVRCSLWYPTTGARYTYTDLVIPANSPGIYQVEWSSKITISSTEMDAMDASTIAKHFIVSTWETSGTYYCHAVNPYPGSGTSWGSGLAISSRNAGLYAAGDNRPVTDGSPNYCNDPIVYGGIPSY